MRYRFLLFSLVLCFSLSAQSYKSRIHYKVKLGDTDQLHQLILLDYTKLLGTALEIENDEIFFQLRSSSEVSIIPLKELRFLGVFTGTTASPVSGPVSTVGLADLTYERTALPYQTKSQLRIINLVYAVTEWNTNEHIQLGLGLAGPLGVIATARLRYTVLPDVHMGVSNQILFPPFSQGFNDGLLVVGDLSAMLTVGDENRFLNLGTGLFYNTDSFSSNAWGHRMAIGGKVSPKWHLYGEALMVLTRSSRGTPLESVLLPTLNASLGVRRHRWQFGILSFFSEDFGVVPVPIPYVGYAYYWGGAAKR